MPRKLPEKGVKTADGWVVDTRQMDLLLECGWWDAGQAADDPTPTCNDGSGLRIDRLLVSHAAPITLVPGTYLVDVPDTPPPSDHRYVAAKFNVHPQASE